MHAALGVPQPVAINCYGKAKIVIYFRLSLYIIDHIITVEVYLIFWRHNYSRIFYNYTRHTLVEVEVEFLFY